MPSIKSDGFNSIPSATGGIARLACARLDEMGKDPAVILSKVGLTPEDARDPAVRLEVRTQIKLLELAAEEVDDEWLGFHLASSFDLREKGLWRFVRTLEIVKPQNVRQKLLEREMTRCVDPTHAMKATFSTNSIGSCHSSRPEKVNNRYIFSNRCDYMGPVRTVITVQSDEAYTEVNELTVSLPQKDLVVARRVGECQEDHAALGQPAGLPVE